MAPVTEDALDRLRRRYEELGEVIDELTDTLARSSSATERVLEPELIRAERTCICGRAPQEPKRRELIIVRMAQDQDLSFGIAKADPRNSKR